MSGMEEEEEDGEPNVQVSCISEFAEYSCNASHSIWAVVSLKAPHQEEKGDEAGSSEQRAGMDLVGVIDKSGSMAGEKMELVKSTLQFVLTQLQDRDRLSLVTYDTDVYVDFPLLHMSTDNKRIASNKIQNLHHGSATNLSGGLMKGLDQISTRPPDEKRNDIASVLLFTDGHANRGVSNADDLVALLKTRYIAPKPDRVGRVGERRSTRIKDMKDSASRKRSSSTANEVSVAKRIRAGGYAGETTVYTFGFGSDHNADMLKKLSDTGQGMYYFIQTEDKISDSFAHCLGGLMSTVAQGIQLDVQAEDGVTIQKVHSARQCLRKDANSFQVTLGDLQSEEGRDVVLKVVIPEATDGTPNPQTLLNVQLDYFNVLTNSMKHTDGMLTIGRQDGRVTNDNANINVKVLKERCRVAMTTAMKEADHKANEGSYEEAQEELAEVIELIRKEYESVSKLQPECGVSELEVMVKDLEECRSNMKTATVWQVKGKGMQKNMLQQYQCQRSANSSGRAYQTKRKGSVVRQCKVFSKGGKAPPKKGKNF